MQIRLATEYDIDSLFELNELFNGKDCTTRELLVGSITNNSQEVVFVAIIEGKAVGFCCVQVFKSMCYKSNYAEITELFVKKEYRRQGAAKSLMVHVEEYFSLQNIKCFQLFTDKENTKAQEFYEKIGYKQSDEIMYRKRL